jgi:hypothetical protein
LPTLTHEFCIDDLYICTGLHFEETLNSVYIVSVQLYLGGPEKGQIFCRVNLKRLVPVIGNTVDGTFPI